MNYTALSNLTQQNQASKGRNVDNSKDDHGDTTYPYTTSIISGSRRKFHTTYKDGSEMVEEYDLKTNELLVRKNRKPSQLGGEGEWVFELGGEVFKPFNPMRDNLAVSSKNPMFSRKDSENAFQFRVRNLPYPKDNFIVSIDDSTQEIVIQTRNKKFYKRFDIPDMKREGLNLEREELQWAHANNTLVISYAKPSIIKRKETAKSLELKQMAGEKQPRDGDVQCPQQ